LLLSLFVHLLLGIVISFIASVPLGPVNLAVAQAALNHDRQTAMRIALGCAAVEFIYCLVAVSGVQLITIVGDKDIKWYIGVFSIPVLLGMGIYNVLKKVKLQEDEAVAQTQRRRTHGAFWLGVSLNLVNPILIPFWITASTTLRSNDWLGEGWGEMISFTLGVCIGTFLLLLLVARLAERGKNFLRPQTLQRVNQGIGVLFILLGLLQLLNMTGWGWR